MQQALGFPVPKKIVNLQADRNNAAGQIGVLQNLAQDFHSSRSVWNELLSTIAQSLNPAQESLDPTEQAGATMGQLQALCVESVVCLASHAQRMLHTQQQGVQQRGDTHMLWRAECAAVEAIARYVQLEMTRGDTVHAVQLIQAACEWFSCPRVSCVFLCCCLMHCTHSKCFLRILNAAKGIAQRILNVSEPYAGLPRSNVSFVPLALVFGEHFDTAAPHHPFGPYQD